MDVESLVRAIGGRASTDRDSDLPPKYEELEDVSPPQYSSVVEEDSNKLSVA